MREYLLLLPILFIFHDMEEIVGFGSFFRKNPWLFDRFPKVLNAYRNISTAGFAAAVYEEFIPIFGISLLAYYFPCDVLFALWYGVFLSIAAHFLIHIGQTVYIRKYIPSFITSLICLPVSVVVLIKSGQFISFDVLSVVLMVAGIVLMMINLKIAHWVMRVLNKKNG
ncbi:MAG: HXXEE domain-containing protein [Clostridiales bacterium]|nr:HXXEE domain-containing protein [Clostridiales bacterium]